MIIKTTRTSLLLLTGRGSVSGRYVSPPSLLLRPLLSPPGKFKEVTVSMENPVSLISAYSFELGITSHADASS